MRTHKVRARLPLRHGADCASEFLTALRFEDAWRERDPDAVLRFFAEGSELLSTSPFPPHGPSRGATAAAGFLREHLTGDIRVDLTRKQIARDQVTWTVRARMCVAAPKPGSARAGSTAFGSVPSISRDFGPD